MMIRIPLISPSAGNHERQNKAFRLTPKNKDVVHSHVLPSRVSDSITIGKYSARALRLSVSSSSRLRFDVEETKAQGDGDRDDGEIRRRRMKRMNQKKIDWMKMRNRRRD
jgi:hypothetical protein